MLKEGRVYQAECCIAGGNRLGLEHDHQPEDNSWLSLWYQEVKPAELNEKGARIVQEERMTFCWCGREFKTVQERDSHRANSNDDERHGPMPNELPMMGGACAIVNLETGEIEVNCKRLMVYGEGDETSSHGETEMVTQEAIRVAKYKLSKNDKVAFYTDNLSAVQGINE